MLFATALLAITIHTDFEGGRLGRIEQVAPTHFRCGVAGQADQDKRNRQANWYYFRVDGAAGKEVTIDMVDLAGEYNYKPNRGAIRAETVPVYSFDRVSWKHFDSVDYDPKEPRLRLRIAPPGESVWIAHVVPYTNGDLARLLKDLSHNKFVTRKSIGRTPQGREMTLLTVTDATVPLASKKVVWLMARQHAWEAPTSWVAEGALRYLASNDATAARLRRENVFQVLPLCDPDGVARGDVRFNGSGYDLNRNWDAIDPKRTPEIAMQHAAIIGWLDAGHPIHLLLAMHNTETGEYLEGPPDETGRTKPLMERFYKLLAEQTTFHAKIPPRSAPATTTAGKPGRMTVYQGLWAERQIPAFLSEQMIAFNPRLGRLPRVEDRIAFGAELVRAMAAAVK